MRTDIFFRDLIDHAGSDTGLDIPFDLAEHPGSQPAGHAHFFLFTRILDDYPVTARTHGCSAFD